jgi:AcrR family transcriptional regulator
MSAPNRKSYASPGREDGARRTRAAVLAAFREMLFADGYRAATIRAVAGRAGVSPETIYKTFGGKPGLIKALWDVTLAGDDEPVAMAERDQLREVWAAGDPAAKVLLWARFVRGVHERLAALAALLAQAGPEAAAVLETAERERRIGVGAFVDHLAEAGVLPASADRARVADACWALTSAAVYTQLTVTAGWDGPAYESWLAGMLAAAGDLRPRRS